MKKVLTCLVTARLTHKHGIPDRNVTFRRSDTSSYMAILERGIPLQVSGRYFIRSDSIPPEATH